jgi:hypothetical protein
VADRQPTKYGHSQISQLVIQHIDNGPLAGLGSADRMNWPTATPFIPSRRPDRHNCVSVASIWPM